MQEAEFVIYVLLRVSNLPMRINIGLVPLHSGIFCVFPDFFSCPAVVLDSLH